MRALLDIDKIKLDGDKLTGLEDLLEGQGARQEALLDEIERSIREATKAAQKSRFGLFK